MYVSSNPRNGLNGYRGMGAEAMGPPEVMGPPVDPTAPLAPPDVQQQIADLWSYLFEQPGQVAVTPAPSTASSMTQWLNQNAGKVAIGAAAFLGLVFLAKAGR